jgi:hypothetical protein
MSRTGSYHWVWVIDMLLAALAAAANLPIREAPVRVPRAAAAY